MNNFLSTRLSLLTRHAVKGSSSRPFTNLVSKSVTSSGNSREVTWPQQRLRGTRGLRVPARTSNHKIIGLTRSQSKEGQRFGKNPARIPDLTRADVKRIFNGVVSTERGNAIINEVQACRRSGRLDSILGIPDDILDVALHYLRKNFPLDEDAAIIARIDQDLDDIRRQPQTRQSLSRQRQSGLDQIRAVNMEFRRERERKEKELELHGSTVSPSTSLKESSTGLPVNGWQVREEPQWVIRYRKGAMETEMPNLTTYDRLIPGGMFLLSIMSASLIFALYYEPPGMEARLFPGVAPAAAAMITMITMNALVLIAWRVPPFWAFMNRNFISVPLKPRSIQLLFASFSHQKLGHFLTNMIPLWFIGAKLHDDLGRGPFLALLVSGAAFTSYVTLAAYVLRNHLAVTNIGASGILTTFVGVACILHEGRSITFPAIPAEWTVNFNTAVVLFTLILLEFNGLRRFGLMNSSLVNYAGHLSGYLYGATIGALIRFYDPKWRSVPRRSFWLPKESAFPSPQSKSPNGQDGV